MDESDIPSGYAPLCNALLFQVIARSVFILEQSPDKKYSDDATQQYGGLSGLQVEMKMYSTHRYGSPGTRPYLPLCLMRADPLTK
nr:hypothetical protein [Marinicella sp. W31]MDC2876029.1 hypothetical protein [Marinicella sp. W31]